MTTQREHTGNGTTVKVLLIGDRQTGKSSLGRAIHGQKFLEDLDSTLGIGFTTSQQCCNGHDATISTWEVNIDNISLLASLNITFDYIALCFVADSRRTLVPLVQLKTLLENSTNAQFVLIGCKSDQLSILSKPELDSYVATCLKAASAMKTPLVFASAVDGFGVTELKDSFIEARLRGHSIRRTLRSKITQLIA